MAETSAKKPDDDSRGDQKFRRRILVALGAGVITAFTPRMKAWRASLDGTREPRPKVAAPERSVKRRV